MSRMWQCEAKQKGNTKIGHYAFFFFDLSFTNPMNTHKKHKSATPAKTGMSIAYS